MSRSNRRPPWEWHDESDPSSTNIDDENLPLRRQPTQPTQHSSWRNTVPSRGSQGALGSAATQLSTTPLHSPASQYRAAHAGVASHSRTKTYPPQGQVPRQLPSVPEHNQSSRSPYLSIEVEAAAAARRAAAILKGLNSRSPSGEQQPENVALPVTVTRPSLQVTSEYTTNDQTSKPSQTTHSTLTDNAEHLGSLQSAREHRLSGPFDLEDVDLNYVNMDELDDFLALYDLPTVEGYVCTVETLAAAVHPKKRLRIAPQLDQSTQIPKKQPLVLKNVRDEVTTATIADLVAAVSAEVPGPANIPSAAELVASFDEFSFEGRERAANIIDSCHPLALTRGALETILSFVSDNDFRGETPPLVLLGALIVFGRIEQARKLILQDLPGGNLNYKLQRALSCVQDDKALDRSSQVSPIASRGLTAVLCPKVITDVIRQSAAEDLFDNSHISMHYLSLLASPSNLCVDFDLSFRGSTDIDCNLTFRDEEYQIGKRHEKFDDMAPERGVILGDLVKSVWLSVDVVNFHRGASKTLPYSEEAAKRAEETLMVAKAPLDEAMWDIHLDQLPQNKFLEDLEDSVEQLVAESEERDSTKIKKRHVEEINLKL
ncbi:uncharacterized protein CcaverHIS019_0402140 [Cutaneotrichosporon cavernicola]|uniref:Uncharacterized protein n=1 Tax=Cutaneotrichosporon cavernicola TaxID=279322 RepID=A0AA48QVJ1_9TREE|nr:uncharacterized protein CcaverHIS019_0402140 [Cutaneotrichosporon cavernicola]BEI91394.1 hypothetical protein CcaverHIS019_0402140 [Cutaneotrichosporon cavernicola]